MFGFVAGWNARNNLQKECYMEYQKASMSGTRLGKTFGYSL